LTQTDALSALTTEDQVPMGQAVCAVAPAASTKKPGDAPTQADESFTATAPEYVPGMQKMPPPALLLLLLLCSSLLLMLLLLLLLLLWLPPLLLSL
jgi:hypothetical protein